MWCPICDVVELEKRKRKVAIIFEINEDIKNIDSCDIIRLHTKSDDIIRIVDADLCEVPERKSTFRPKEWWRDRDYYDNGYNDCLDDLLNKK